jgi:hypothetical protein
MHYMVFAAGRRYLPGHAAQAPAMPPIGLVWDSSPIGVFSADSAERACQAAARKHGAAGTFFAIEGYPWGLEMVEVEGVTELGNETDPQAVRIRDLERQVLERD